MGTYSLGEESVVQERGDGQSNYILQRHMPEKLLYNNIIWNVNIKNNSIFECVVIKTLYDCKFLKKGRKMSINGKS